MPNTERLSVDTNGATVRYVRRQLGITVARLAAEVGVSTTYIRRIELGHTQSVSPVVFAALCLALRLEDRRVLLASPRPVAGEPATLDDPDPVDEALDARDPVDDALDAQDPDDRPRTALTDCIAS